MKKYLKLSLLLGGSLVFGVGAEAAKTAASNFNYEFQMPAALDQAEDINYEQINYSRHSGAKKSQEYLVSIARELHAIMRNIERNADESTITENEIGDWVNNWALAELLNIRVSNLDTANVGTAIEDNTSFRITVRFAQEHHVHWLDDVTFSFVPVITESQDGEVSINGWYCETDADWHNFTRLWGDPVAAGSTPSPGQSTQGAKSMLTRDLPYPFKQCIVSTTASNIQLIGTGADGTNAAEYGLSDTDAFQTE